MRRREVVPGGELERRAGAGDLGAAEDRGPAAQCVGDAAQLLAGRRRSSLLERRQTTGELVVPALDQRRHGVAPAELVSEPVEDFRIDFEDGYGNRPSAEEDGHAESAAREAGKGHAAGTLPPFLGIRIKPLTEEL
ncbi:MAG TPA: hypothetical protein PKD63_01865, partial [Solirubrobacteraceae bacterium]|nr:hypothetical protein [Solirubrobacteraceae bacterium]